ncbi:MAG: hypothetical protein EOO22_04330 [Comamonadaceae bacterium]|nr:MAG: hypothetical protein EOO22_04330 [Comamonadaceae bacterium]
MATVEKMFLLDIEERLHADADGSLRKEMTKHFEEVRQALIVQRRQLQPPEAYRQIQAALMAVEAALHVLQFIQVRKD